MICDSLRLKREGTLKYPCVYRPPCGKLKYSKWWPWKHAKVLFFCFWPKINFLSKFGPNNQNCLFKPKFCTKTYSNMKNSMIMFIFSVFKRKYSFSGNSFQKIKIVCWSWNLEPRLIEISTIRWWFSFFFLFRSEIAFLDKFDQKRQYHQLKNTFGT